MSAVPILDDQTLCIRETQKPPGLVVPFAPTPPIERSAPKPPAAGGGTQGPAKVDSEPMCEALHPGRFDELRILADSFEDAQRSRIQIQNRLRSGTVPSAPVDEALKSLEHAEKKLGLAMRKSFRTAAPDVYAWQQATVGVGEHLLARLLGVIGHPVVAYPHHWEGDGTDRILVVDAPYLRSVSQLWSYCGHGDPNRKKRKGMSADEAFGLGSPRAKMIVHLLAESAMKCTGSQGTVDTQSPDASGADLPSGPTQQSTPDVDAAPGEPSSDDAKDLPEPRAQARRRSPYRDTYDQAKERYTERDWTPGHRHNAALRLTGKHILKDLWIVTRQGMNQ